MANELPKIVNADAHESDNGNPTREKPAQEVSGFVGESREFVRRWLLDPELWEADFVVGSVAAVLTFVILVAYSLLRDAKGQPGLSHRGWAIMLLVIYHASYLVLRSVVLHARSSQD